MAAAHEHGDVVVRIDGLHKSFGHLEVVRGVDLEVRRGEVVVIFGRSGSGKSTVLRCVNFIEDPTEGSIEVAGIRLTGGHRTRRKRDQIRRLRLHVGMVFQQFNLFPNMTVLENVTCAPRLAGRAAMPRSPSAATTSSTGSASPTRRASTRSGCPAASNSASPSRGRWPWSPT